MVRNSSDSFIWFIAGAAIGASIALLYAPKTGRDTRRLIAKKTREGREVVSDASRDLADKGRELFEKGRRVADDAAELFERGRKLVEG
jgi:gas vesicle protein